MQFPRNLIAHQKQISIKFIGLQKISSIQKKTLQCLTFTQKIVRQGENRKILLTVRGIKLSKLTQM